MSSYWAGYSSSALVLRKSEFDDFLRKYNERNETDVLHEVDEMGEFLNEYPFIRSAFKEKQSMGLPRCFYIANINPDDCDGMYLIPYVIEGKPNNPTDPNFQDMDLCSDDLYVVFSDKQLDCANAFFEHPYESYEDFVLEFKDKMAHYLPDDFDWNTHIGSFSYAAGGSGE